MRRLALAGVLVAALVVAGCGTRPAPAAGSAPVAKPSGTAQFNATDVMFLQMMLVHHEPMATLLSLGRTQTTRDDIRALAGELDRARADSTATISGWLTQWGQPLTSEGHPDAHAAHGGLPLIDDTQLRDLAAMNGTEFDTAFLNMLIGHQHSAVELARMEVQGGTNPQAMELARHTDEDVRTQIQRLLRMVAS